MTPNSGFSRVTAAIIAQAVKAAWLDNRAKRVALALGCCGGGYCDGRGIGSAGRGRSGFEGQRLT